MADRWNLTVTGAGDRSRGQDALDALLLDFTNNLTAKGFTVENAKLSYTGVTVVVAPPDADAEVVK